MANCIQVRGVTIWISIKIPIKNAPSFCTFKYRFKYYIVIKTGP